MYVYIIYFIVLFFGKKILTYLCTYLLTAVETRRVFRGLPAEVYLR